MVLHPAERGAPDGVHVVHQEDGQWHQQWVSLREWHPNFKKIKPVVKILKFEDIQSIHYSYFHHIYYIKQN